MQKRVVQADAIPETLWPHVSAVIASRTGLHFPDERRSDLQRGLADAATELGFEDARSCATWLVSGEPTRPQLDTLASYLTVGETYFFREPRAFNALATQILPALLAKRRGVEQRLRIWSAGCSSGEETYSLAILMRQVLPDWKDWHISILGTDINNQFLEKARHGVYGEWSFRDTPPEIKELYFDRVGDRRYSVRQDVRGCVHFAQMNLAQDDFPSLVTDTNAMDIVFCRNMLMYFEPSQAAMLIRKLRHCLVDDGWLVVSPSECSQTLFSEFAAVNFPGAVLYRKGNPESQAPTELRQEWRPAVSARATEEPAAEPSRSVPRQVSSRAVPKPEDFARVTRTLANEGRLTEALASSERWIASDKLDPVAYYIHAIVQQELGRAEPARHALQRAIYLDPDFALAHFALGNLASRARSGTRHFANALELLSRMPSGAIVPESDGLTAGRLCEMIAALLPTRAAPT